MQQNKMKIINTWKTYGLVNIRLLWLNLPHCFLVANFLQVEETKLWTESIYRKTSVMLPSLWAPLTMCGCYVFLSAASWRRCRAEEELGDERLQRWWGGELSLIKWHQSVGGPGVHAATDGVLYVFPFATRPYIWVCIVEAQCKSNKHTHAHREQVCHSSRHERSWVLKHWHFPVPAGLEGMVAADCCWSCCLCFSRAEYRK